MNGGKKGGKDRGLQLSKYSPRLRPDGVIKAGLGGGGSIMYFKI